MNRLALIALIVPCLHPPRDFKGTLEETSQQAIIVWRDGREDLVLKVDYKMTGEKLPGDLAWVVPTPTQPDHYAVASGAIFEEIFQMAEQHSLRRLENGKGLRDSDTGPKQEAVTVLARVSVGEYDITALKATGKDAAKELNTWLAGRGYGEVPPANLAFFVDKGWTFLAIKINKEKGEESLKKEGGFRPLRISFASATIVYPLKFSSHQGVFSVTVYVLTEKPVKAPTWLKERGFHSDLVDDKGSQSVALDESELQFNLRHLEHLADAAATEEERTNARMKIAVIKTSEPESSETELWKLLKEVAKGKTGALKTTLLTKFVGEKINGDGNKLADWKSDFELEVEK